MRIALELGKFLYEVVEMDLMEFALWVEYLKMVDKQRARAKPR